MARQKGTANFSGTLEVLAGGPIDARSVVPTLADLTVASNFPYAYVGLETYVVSENKKYRLIAADVTQSSNWEEIGSGGGGGGGEGGKMLTGTLLASGWVNNSQTVTVSGVKADTIGTVGILNTATAEQVTAAKSAGIVATGLAANSVTFKCDNVPSVDIPFGVLIPGGGGGAEIDIDDALSSTSENPVQNKVITGALDATYKTTDGTIIGAFQDNDYFPYFSPGYTPPQKKISGANIKTTIKNYLENYFLKSVPTASANVLGGIKVGNNLSIDANGVLSAEGGSVPIVANQFEKSDLYSTTEKIVGCWVDGRPVYQKTISCGTFPNNSTKQVAHGISNLSQVVKIFGFAKNTVNNEWNMIPIAMQSSNLLQYQVRCKITLTNVEIITGTSYEQAMDCYITIQYTKTTDAANSFNYADENDYSTNEKIVGFWIDGKPVYQKSFSESGVSLSNSKQYQKTITGLKIKQIIKCSSYVKGANGYGFAGGESGQSDFWFTFWTYLDNLYLSLKYNDPNSNTADYCCTIQYTKTTD